MKKRQYDAYLSAVPLTDIQENFLIASDGTIYEGRGFAYEGEHTKDQATTSYNNQAIGVSFIGNYTETSLSTEQIESFEYFVQQMISNGTLIDENFKLYYNEQLIGSNESNDELYKSVRNFTNWQESKLNFQ